MSRSKLKFILFLLPLCGLWFMAQGSYIHAKAILAQKLLEAAWTETLDGRKEVKPWPWADTWPVTRLNVPRLGISRIVLAGANGSALAFGPGHLFNSAYPGAHGNTIIAGHRDTHFEFLQELEQGDFLELQGREGHVFIYQIRDIQIVDERDLDYLKQSTLRQLTLLTCYPFDALRTGGSRRYLVQAEYRATRYAAHELNNAHAT